MATWVVIEAELLGHVTEFNRLYKCLNKSKLPKGNIVQEHVENLITSYNGVVATFSQHSNRLTEGHVEVFINHFNSIRDKLVILFNRLRINILVPLQITEYIDSKTQDPNFDDSIVQADDDDMPQDPESFTRLCGSILNVKYLGDPLGLNSFINTVEFLEILCKPENAEVLRRFIVQKLDGKALDAVPDIDNKTLKQIKDALKGNIRPDSSDVIEGRIVALRQDHMTAQEFAKTAEELADALKRTYIIEGMTETKASDMTIKKTVELCRNNTRSTLVKSVLASTSFPDAKSVISKLLVESAADVKEKQVLAYRRFDARRSRGNGSGYAGYRNGFRGNNGNGQRNVNNYQGQSQNQRQNDSRGRGGYRGNGGNRNNNHNNNGGYRGRNRGNDGGNASVRYMEQGNQQAPQSRPLGDEAN